MASRRSRIWKVATSALALLRAHWGHCASLYAWTYISTFWSWILELGGSRDCLFMSYLAVPAAAVAIRHSLNAAYSYSWQKLSYWEVVLLARKQEYFTASLTECEYIHSGGSFSIWPCAWTSLLLGTCTAHSHADQSLCWKDYILPNQYFQFGPHAFDSRKLLETPQAVFAVNSITWKNPGEYQEVSWKQEDAEMQSPLVRWDELKWSCLTICAPHGTKAQTAFKQLF